MPVTLLKKLLGGDNTPSLGVAMVVDDEVQMRELLGVHLDSLGFEVMKVDSASEAQAALDKGATPSVFVLDIKLQGEDGVTFAKRVRKRPDSAKTPIVFVSGAFPKNALEKLEKSIPHCATLLKPVKARVFKETVMALNPTPPVPKRKRSPSARLPRR